MNKRPDPKELLELVQKEERNQLKGKLKIFLGAAPGVGKTYAMLEDALVRKKDGLDVVAGIVETHSRKETQVFLDKLEELPRRTIAYRGKEFKEFDLDATLIRNPDLVLVDEMAHSNIPGSRHNKRWQDIMELLDKGINVYSTINVQHIESLNNIITQITGVIVRETVPDTFIEEADAIELIDLPPADLIKRLEEGKIYLPTDIGAAVEHFFRKSNLSALRELALRVTADKVDVEVLSHRKDQDIAKIIPVAERLMVCIGPQSDSPKLIRATYRMAKSLHAKWIAVSVEVPHSGSTLEEKQKVIEYLRLVEQLGGESLLIGGANIVDEILRLAHDRNVTKIVLGKPVRSRWQDLFKLSLADQLVRHSIDIDLYILRGEVHKQKLKNETSDIPRTHKFNYLTCLVTISICSLVNYLLNNYVEPSIIVMVYFLGIIYIAIQGYFGPALLASVISVASYGLFFAPTQLSFSFSNIQYFITLIAMFFVSQMIAHLGLIRKQQAETARFREQRIDAMHQLNKHLARARGVDKLLEIAYQHISETFDCKMVVFLPNSEKKLIPFGIDKTNELMSAKDLSVVHWVYELGQIAGLGTQTLPENNAIYVPLLGITGTIGVIRLLPNIPGRLFRPEQLHFLEDFANQIAMALEVDRLQDESKKTELLIETDRVRNIVLKYISDIIKEPLKDLIILADNLIEIGKKSDAILIEDLGNSIYFNTSEINHLINNISQIAHLESSEITLSKESHSLYTAANSALIRLSRRIGHRPILMKLAEDFPKVPFNKVYMEHVFFNIIENALKYTPPSTVIEISGTLEPNRVVISIKDRGPGLALEDINQIFIKFYRGQANTKVKGMGLGLTICQRIIHMHGGEIWAENRPKGGAIFRFTLPLNKV